MYRIKTNNYTRKFIVLFVLFAVVKYIVLYFILKKKKFELLYFVLRIVLYLLQNTKFFTLYSLEGYIPII